MKPIIQTDSCESAHMGYAIAGLHVVMDDGTETDVSAVMCTSSRLGHDAWMLGDEPDTGPDFSGLEHYGTR